MQDLAEGIYLIPGRPRYTINAYLADGVLVDAGTPSARRRIIRGLGRSTPTSHLVTHAHPDHFGSSAAICKHFGLSLACGETDAVAVESGRPEVSDTFLGKRVLTRIPPPSGYPVATRLKEGDMVGRFQVLDVPGHSRGHIALWREWDGTLIMGDVLWNLNPLTRQVGLREPPVFTSIDPALNRASARRLATLEPKLVLFGHGPPLRDPQVLTSFVEGLP